jgi:hypothetical protein
LPASLPFFGWFHGQIFIVRTAWGSWKSSRRTIELLSFVTETRYNEFQDCSQLLERSVSKGIELTLNQDTLQCRIRLKTRCVICGTLLSGQIHSEDPQFKFRAREFSRCFERQEIEHFSFNTHLIILRIWANQ